MRSHTNTTTDHDEIRRWVEQHHGLPATVGDWPAGIAMLRIDFSEGVAPDNVRRIGWEEWFAQFERRELALLYQQGGEDSTFFRLVHR